jgi:hypothetical protein
VRLEERIKEQFPILFITLLSVLIGCLFADLVSQAHSRMALWPLDLGTLRTWGQIVAMGTNALSSWVFLAHVGISRLRIPTLADSLIVFLTPVPLLIGNSLIGLKEIWPWLYYSSFFLTISLGSLFVQTRMTCTERGLASFSRLSSPFGPASVLYLGIPFYMAAGWADSHAMLSPTTEMLLAMSPTPAALFFLWLFFRSWHRVIAEADMVGS